MTINGQTTAYCYNYADQLVATSDPTTTTPAYDDHGNTIKLGSTATPMRFAYDSSDRNTGITQRNDAGTGFATYYSRDVQGRITYREKATMTNWTSTPVQQTWYGFTGSGDTPDFTKNASGTVTEKYLRLAGGVTLTVRPNEQNANNQKTYSLRNVHGDVFAQTNTNGALVTKHITGPYGERVPGQINPNNTVSGTTHNYVGLAQKILK